MIVMESAPESQVVVESKPPELRVERTDISFADISRDKVRIQVMLHNPGSQPSLPTVVKLESAVLGAFVPWYPLTRLLVPELAPGQSHMVSTDVARPQMVPLGGFNRVPPDRLLTAIHSPDMPLPPAGRLASLLNRWRPRDPASMPRKIPSAQVTLAHDLWDLVGRRQPYWAGNINVFIGQRAVERHMAKALKVYPRRTNLAMFFVGEPNSHDAYSFQLGGLASDWKACLFKVDRRAKRLYDLAGDPLLEGTWVESDGGMIVLLAARPAADCPAANLEVQVTKKSCLRTAVVEFTLDPAGQGAGCYTV